MGTDLSITYYFGQIKPAYRGELALIVEKEERQLTYKELTLNSADLIQATEEGVHSPIRAYIGVNEKAKRDLQLMDIRKLRNLHDLDVIIVREEIVDRRHREICDLLNSSMDAMIATGK